MIRRNALILQGLQKRRGIPQVLLTVIAHAVYINLPLLIFMDANGVEKFIRGAQGRAAGEEDAVNGFDDV